MADAGGEGEGERLARESKGSGGGYKKSVVDCCSARRARERSEFMIVMGAKGREREGERERNFVKR